MEGRLLLGKNLEPSPAAGSHYLAGPVPAWPVTQESGFLLQMGCS